MRNAVVTGCPRADLGEVGALLATALQYRGVRGLVSTGGQHVLPGDAILADDDGVVVIPRCPVSGALAAAKARADTERASRAAFRHGELGLDRYGLRAVLAQLGVGYVDYQSYREAPR